MQQDLLDILFLNRKQLASAAQASASSTANLGDIASGSATTASASSPNPAPPATSPTPSVAAPVPNMAGGDNSGSSSTSTSTGTGEPQCPVDHKTRDVWLSQARATSGSNDAATRRHPHATSPQPPHPAPSATAFPSSSSWSWNPMTWRIPFYSSSASASPPSTTRPPRRPTDALNTDRVVSTIPRSSTPGASACPVNHEAETGADAATGNWIYPSEKMFFEAMKRKGTAGSARAADMRTVVPIHNAVNERAWKEIREWEAPYTGEGKCDGPKLESFAGLSTQLSPKARINTWLGYTAPFDRHDWVVDRCGTKVEYVIDFYAGRSSQSAAGQTQQQLNFYLDVRPKLNSWEGAKMRTLRALGVV